MGIHDSDITAFYIFHLRMPAPWLNHTVDGRNPSPPQTGMMMTPFLANTKQTLWFQPWFQSGTGFRSPVSCLFLAGARPWRTGAGALNRRSGPRSAWDQDSGSSAPPRPAGCGRWASLGKELADIRHQNELHSPLLGPPVERLE